MCKYSQLGGEGLVNNRAREGDGHDNASNWKLVSVYLHHGTVLD